MSRVFFDTNVFVYFFQGHPEFGPPVRDLWHRLQKGSDELLTSFLTLGEIQVRSKGTSNLPEAKLQAAFIDRTATLVPFDRAAATAFVAYREQTTAKGADAIQLACAATAGARFFVTCDKKLLNARVQAFDLFVVTPSTIPI